MKKEKIVPLPKDPEAIKKLESSRFVFRSSQNALENNDQIAYEWLEDCVIRKMASVEFGRDDTGKDTATIKMINPKTKEEEIVYYTVDETQIASLKKISEGEVLVIEDTKKETEE